ncbi:MAG TPA: hypothetical protein VHE83_18230, partial [Mycobacteriales bacterium]|nr:hypothetical protein [Mycobacteriales bacterium]
MTYGTGQRRRCLLATTVAGAALLAAACGNRHSHAEVVAAANPGVTVTGPTAAAPAPLDGSAGSTTPVTTTATTAATTPA